MATLHLLEIVRDQPRPVKFYHASSSEIFGNATESPQTELTPLQPASPYGCAKAYSFYIVRNYRTCRLLNSPSDWTFLFMIHKDLVRQDLTRKDLACP